MSIQTNKEIISELVELVIGEVSAKMGGNTIALLPVINMLKLKMRSIDDNDAASLVDTVHKISALIETKTGVLSPYHCGVVDSAAIIKPSSVL